MIINVFVSTFILFVFQKEENTCKSQHPLLLLLRVMSLRTNPWGCVNTHMSEYLSPEGQWAFNFPDLPVDLARFTIKSHEQADKLQQETVPSSWRSPPPPPKKKLIHARVISVLRYISLWLIAKLLGFFFISTSWMYLSRSGCIYYQWDEERVKRTEKTARGVICHRPW